MLPDKINLTCDTIAAYKKTEYRSYQTSAKVIK